MYNYMETEAALESGFPLSSYSKFSINASSNAFNSTKTLVLRIIKDAGIISRKDLSIHSGLTPASITAIIRELTAKGLVQESGSISGTQGRRMTGLSLVTDKFCTISGRITSHYFAVGLYDINSECIDVKKTYFDVFKDIRASTEAIAAQVYYYLDMAKEKNLTPMAITFGLTGSFRITENDYIMIGKDGRYMDIKEFFRHEFNLPFYCDNSNTFSMYKLACDRKYNYLQNQTIVLVGVSYSIDTTIMHNRSIISGAVNIPGSAGKTIIDGSAPENFITLEECVSTHALLEMAKKEAAEAPYSSLKYIENLTSRDLINAFYEGDHVAIKIYTNAANALGRYFAQLITLLNPHKILVVDEIPMNDTFERMLIDSTRRQLSRNAAYFPEIDCLNAPSRSTKYDPTIIGGSMYVTNKILQSVEWLDSLEKVSSAEEEN